MKNIKIGNIPKSAIASLAKTLSNPNKEQARMLPDSAGGEVPKQLQNARTDIYTYFTINDGKTHLLYSAINWVKIKLELETAGPVSIGTQANIEPVLSGRGRLLDTSEEFEAFLPKGTRIYIVSETVNRIGVTIEPVPWMEQLSGELQNGFAIVRAGVGQAAQAITAAIEALRGKGNITTPTGVAPSQLPIPAPGSIIRPRLTGLPKKLTAMQRLKRMR